MKTMERFYCRHTVKLQSRHPHVQVEDVHRQIMTFKASCVWLPVRDFGVLLFAHLTIPDTKQCQAALELYGFVVLLLF